MSHKVHSFGLYRDDFLAITSGSGPQIDRIKKDLIKIFKAEGLNMSFEGPPSSIVNFLDIELNLTNFSYRPYTKPENTLL